MARQRSECPELMSGDYLRLNRKLPAHQYVQHFLPPESFSIIHNDWLNLPDTFNRTASEGHS